MTVRTFAVATALTSVFALAWPVAASPVATAAYEEGLAAYEDCHWNEAIIQFERAATAGHLRAQEILGMMLPLGPTLYGDEVRQNPVAARRWFDHASTSGSELGTLMVRRIAAAPETRADARR
jgi:TPR repeat protein